MKYRSVPRLLSMLAVWLVLLAWHLTAARVGLIGAVLFLLVLALPLAMSGAEAALYRRHAFRNEYLSGPSWLERVVCAVPLVLAVEGARALLLAALLLVATLSLAVHEWVLLLLDVFLLALLMPRLPGLLHTVVKPVYLFALSRRWAIWASTLLLWLQWLIALVLAQSDDYRGLPWSEALAHATAPTAASADGSPLSLLLRAGAGVQGLAAWSGYRLAHGGDDPAQGLIAGLCLAGILALWFVLAWAYSRALVGALARPFAIWRPRPRRGDGGDPVFETWWN